MHQTLSQQNESDAAQMHMALEIADSAMTYRSRYLNQFQVVPFLDLLLLDHTNPRSIAYQLATIGDHAEKFPKHDSGPAARNRANHFGRSTVAIAACHPATLAMSDESGRRTALVTLAEIIDDAMERLSDAIADAYFQHAARRRAGAARSEAG